MAWTTPATAVAGDTLTASFWNTHVRDNLSWAGRAGISGWASYTPTWTSSGTAPAIGNGTASGFYQHVGYGLIVVGHIVFGSTSTYGTGNYSFATPVTAALHSLTYSGFGHALLVDTGTATRHGIVVVLQDTIQIRYTDTGSSLVGQTTPHTWANTDEIHFSYIAESAS